MSTLTYNPNQDQPEFSEEELNSIQVGEQMEAEQQQMLAGKFQDAEQLEQAYIDGVLLRQECLHQGAGIRSVGKDCAVGGHQQRGQQ